MSSRRSMTRDIHESIRLLLGKNVKILLKAPVKQETKPGGDKTENRILVFTAHRLFVMTAKVPARIDHHFHYLDLKGVDSKRPNHVAFTFHAASGGGDSKKTVTYAFRPNTEAAPNAGEGAVDEMLVVLISAVKRVFPGVPVERVIGKVDVQPAGDPSRAHVREMLAWQQPDMKLVGPCGGFSAQYSCMCDYYSLPFREEVAWDVDTIYFSHDSHEMCLQDFEHLDHRDQLCIISSLEHNTWFTRLKASGNSAKLPTDVCERILQVVGKSSALQELHVASIGARWEFAARLAQAVSHNPSSALTSLDLSCNFVEDKGLNHLSQALGKQHPRGLRHINLSYCSLTPKGLANFASCLSANRSNASTLTYLNLAGNSLKDESQALCSFLAQPNVVAILDISATETHLDSLFGALLRGCVTALTHLNLSRNSFSASKKAKEIPASFKQFFATTLALQYLNMSHCKLPSEALKHLLLGLACNESTANVELNLSSNSLSGPGATVIESCIGGVKCIARLDLSENSIDAEMAGVMQGVARNHAILSLNVSKNMTGIKPKHLPAVMEAIVQLIQEEETSLQKLNLSDCKLKAEINNVINALGSNQCLQHLDISGNQMGDVGARLLAKALQINTRLKIINLDRNGITLQGYTDITYALQSNYAMRHIPFPTFDMQPFVKTHPDRVDAIVHRMQELLQRNSSPHRFRNTAQAFRLTQGFLLSSTQQILDRVSAQTQDNIDALVKLNPEVADSEDVELGRGMIQDAENAKHLLSALHEVTARGTDVDSKLKSVSHDLSSFITSHVHQNVEAMLGCAEKQCPRIMAGQHQDGNTKKAELRTACQKKCQISPDFVTGLIMDQLGLEVHNKINELNLIIANHISDRVIDEVIEGLGMQSKVLVSEVGSLRKKRSLTPDSMLGGSVASGIGGVSVGSKGRSSSVSESLELPHSESASLAGGAAGDAISQKSESSPLGTPQTSKRKSLHGRKLRPKSVADGNKEGDKDADFSSSSSVLSELSQANNKTLVKNGPGEDDTVPELPSATALQHLGKARPRRSKRHAPSRGAVVQPSADQEDEGLSKFYTSSANSSFSPGSTPSGSPMQDFSPRSTSMVANSSTTSTSRDREDGKRSTSSSGLFGYQKKAPSSPEADRRSPLPSAKSGKAGAGLSCLASSAMDEEKGATAANSLGKPSPEKRSLSPSLHSITDMFSSSRGKDSKQSSPKPENKAAAGVATASVGISPLATRKTDSDLVVKRRSLNAPAPGAVEEEASTARAMSPSDEAGKRTPEGVVKRVGVGHGGNLDLLAEMREKRASMQTTPKSSAEEESPSRVAAAPAAEDPSKSVFGQVKLRSTGLAGSLTSPTTEFAATSPGIGGKADDKDAGRGGSIVGLRSTKFSSSLGSASTTAPISSSPPASSSSPGPSGAPGAAAQPGTSPSNPTGVPAPTGPTEPSTGGSIVYPKPKPPTKPRPWSIVGVDRKSGEVTSVAGSTDTAPVPAARKLPAAASLSTTTAAPSAAGSKPSQANSAAALAAASRKSSVRDMINNMNKAGTDDSGGTPTEQRRKGSNSLPRGVGPPTSSAAEDTTVLSRSPGNLSKQSSASAVPAASSSPGQSKRKATESTSDDPRILKLDDDFAFDDVMDV